MSTGELSVAMYILETTSNRKAFSIAEFCKKYIYNIIKKQMVTKKILPSMDVNEADMMYNLKIAFIYVLYLNQNTKRKK